MRLAAALIPFVRKEAVEELLHLQRATQRGGDFEAIGIECCRLPPNRVFGLSTVNVTEK